MACLVAILFQEVVQSRSFWEAGKKAIGWEGFSFVVVFGVAFGLLQMKRFRAARVAFTIAALALAAKLMSSSETYLPVAWVVHAKWISGITAFLFLFGMLYWVKQEERAAAVVPKTQPDPSFAPADVTSPYIICLRDERGPDVVSLDRHQVFRESEYFGAGAMRVVSAAFTNAPNPQNRIGKANRVSAQVIFSTPDWPDREEYRMHHGCWLNEESPYVSFDHDTVQHLIIGVFQHKKDGSGGFEPDFTIYGTSPDRNAPLTEIPDRFRDRFNVKVNLIIGESGQVFSYDYDLQITRGTSFSFGYVSEEEKRLGKESLKDEIKKLIKQGDALFNAPLVNADWDKFYSEVHTWTATVAKLIRQSFGVAVASRVESSTVTHTYPHELTEERHGFLNEYYSRFAALQQIAREQGVNFTTTSTEAVNKLRNARIRQDLSTLRGEGFALLRNVVESYDSSQRMQSMRWEDRVYDYLDRNVHRSLASAFMNDDGAVTYTVPEGVKVYQKDLLDRLHTRLTKLDAIIEATG